MSLFRQGVVAHLLVHGYLGSPADLEPLAGALAKDLQAPDGLEILPLPGHQGDRIPAFDPAACLAAVAEAIDRHLAGGHRVVLIGHSTGGSLLLAELARRLQGGPAGLDGLLLLVLCATPARIGPDYPQRWAAHRNALAGEGEPSLDDVGALVGLVNRLARGPSLALPAPVLIVQGEADELVPAASAEAWRAGRFAGPVRLARIPAARHHLFAGAGAELAIDTIRRSVADARQRPDATAAAALFDLEPGLLPFAAAWPDSLRHLLGGPAGRHALGEAFTPEPIAPTAPTLANIEITTRCTLGCVACARTQRKLQSRFMSRDDFRVALEALPHAWRVMLVGLGEPLLHPEAVDFIGLAVAAGRRVGLVTNAMQLDADMSRALCTSGLAGITFSLDAMDQGLATRVRHGSDMALIRANIAGFMQERKRRGIGLGTSVFTALTADTIDELTAIIDFTADHGIDALMLTDLNFPANQARSVHKALTPEHRRSLRQALRHAAARHLPVLSVRGLEEFALPRRYLDHLLLDGESIAERSPRRTHCLSPWQAIPVSVDGNVSFCDCQPGTLIGNLRMPLSAWWNGPAMVEQRRRMLSDNPPHDCLACPRF